MARRNCLLFASLLVWWFVGGCRESREALPPKAPRPVNVMTLRQRPPARSYHVSGSVRSWKTEQIGFEVTGRVEWVLEPGSDVERRIMLADGGVIKEGTPLAKIDPASYEVAVEVAKAELEVARLQMASLRIRLDDALPADRESAEADRSLAQTEFNRLEGLVRQNAASTSALDKARNTLRTCEARIKSVAATEKQTQAEFKSAEARVASAQQALKDAERDLANTVLYASYRGVISDVHVVPGSLVSPGSPVVTLQMMDPIKVEIEVSAEKSREFRRRSQLPVSYKLPDGSQKNGHGLLYRVDSRAEPTTRTFSVTLLMLNELLHRPLPDHLEAADVARTEIIWPLRVNRIVGVPEDVSIVEERVIYEDDKGPYVYQITNARLRTTFPEVLTVKRQHVVKRELTVPFLGIWTLREVEFVNADEIADDTLIAGQLQVDEGTIEEWHGNSVVHDFGSQWMLRPGDIVNVNLSGASGEDGFYIPLRAIYEESGATYVFVVEGDVVRRLQVDAVLPETLSGGSLIEVKADDGGDSGKSMSLVDGMQLVTEGVHYLQDGDRVVVVQQASEDDTTDQER